MCYSTPQRMKTEIASVVSTHLLPRSGNVNLGRSFKDGRARTVRTIRRVATIEIKRRWIQSSLTRRGGIPGHRLQALKDLPKVKRR